LELLIRKKADMSKINLHKLYNLPEVKYNIEKLKLTTAFSEIDYSMGSDDEMEEEEVGEKQKQTEQPKSIYILILLLLLLLFATVSFSHIFIFVSLSFSFLIFFTIH
jgi:hypothetical protein